MPRERIELPYLRLQCNALAAKPPRLLYQAPEGTLWRKIESNYHICSASTTDYHYQISPYHAPFFFLAMAHCALFLNF